MEINDQHARESLCKIQLFYNPLQVTNRYTSRYFECYSLYFTPFLRLLTPKGAILRDGGVKMPKTTFGNVLQGYNSFRVYIFMFEGVQTYILWKKQKRALNNNFLYTILGVQQLLLLHTPEHFPLPWHGKIHNKTLDLILKQFKIKTSVIAPLGYLVSRSKPTKWSNCY